jgi:plastocyanin
LFGFLATGAAIAVALAPMPAMAASHWNVRVGAQTTDAGVQANGFFNNNITIHAGDTVDWNWNAREIHTVTFGAPPGPLLIVDPGVSIVPGAGIAAVGDGFSYTGGFASSGVFGVNAASNTFSLTFPTVGTYTYVCLLHEGMNGTVNVVSANSALAVTQADYDRASKARQSQLLGLGRSLIGQGTALVAPAQVSAGTGQLVSGIGSVADLRFAPDKRVVHVGDTVTWTNLDPQTPHTVTFGDEPPSWANNPFASYPAANVTANPARVGPSAFVNSGFVAKAKEFEVPNTFAATFTSPGTYPYICALHDDLGMTGTIVVLP